MQEQSGKSQSWLPLLAVFFALAFVSSVTVSALGVVSLAPAANAQGNAQADAPATRRCPECGWIETARSIPGGTDNLAVRIREYTVRMADGSIRVFTGSPDQRWRLGEQLVFIDGAGRDDR